VAAAATNPISLRPASLQGPTVSLADVKLFGTKLVITVAVGVVQATLAFGGNAPGVYAASSDITAKLTGLLGKFDVTVDLLTAASALTSGGVSALLGAFDLPGKFSVHIDAFEVSVPSVVKITGTGVDITWDPSFTPVAPDFKGQKLVTVTTAKIEFPSFGVTGNIAGLEIRTDGFHVTHFDVTYKPGMNSNGNTAPSSIKLGGILEFDDLRFGLNNFDVQFKQSGSVDITGEIFFASGGVRFLPGRPISGTISDGPDQGTEAIHAGLVFEHGKVKAFKLDVDTLKVPFGPYLTTP